MGSSIRLFSIRGISIRMHFTFPLILIWMAVQFGLIQGKGVSGAVFGVLVTLILFVIVVLHELGHSVAAQHYHVPVGQIVLLPIGGVAQLGRMPEKPMQEFVIAIAGPLVNLGLAMVMVVGIFIFGGGLEGLTWWGIMQDMGTLSVRSIFDYIFITNLFLGVFNLLPAFPMDGGRVLRALLATQMDYLRATTIAVFIGQTMAWLLGLGGFLGGGLFLILIAIFIYLGAGQEGQMVLVRQTLRGLIVEQAYSRQVQALSPNSTLKDATDLTLTTLQADFPVCDREQLVGLLTYSRLLEALHSHGTDTPVQEVMYTDVPTVSPDEEIFTVQQLLAEHKLDAVPVVGDERFLGLITNRDISELYRLVSSQPNVIPRLETG